jgi:glutathione S-transferase
MHSINLTALATLLALVLYMVMIQRVGAARHKSGLQAPAVVGDPTFERHYRVQMNTLESMPVFLASLWLFTYYWGEFFAAGLGAIWIVGRIIYMLSYVNDPARRGAGFAIQGIALVALTLGAMAGAIRMLLATGGE